MIWGMGQLLGYERFSRKAKPSGSLTTNSFDGLRRLTNRADGIGSTLLARE